MEIEKVPDALRERLGIEATGGLLQLLEREYSERRADVIAACTERFERRLVEEAAGLRVQIAQVEASVRGDMAEMGASIRQEMAAMGASICQEMAAMGAGIRQEMAAMGASIRQEMAAMGAATRQEMAATDASLRQHTAELAAGIRVDMASGRVELLKWCFLFWIGQVVAVGTLISIMLRLLR